MPTTPAVIAVRDTVDPYRVEGYAEEVTYREIIGGVDSGLVSFAPGGWLCRLDLYLDQPGPTTAPLKRIQHTIGTDPTLALMILTPTDMALLKHSSYIRKVIVTSPQGQPYVIVDGFLVPKT